MALFLSPAKAGFWILRGLIPGLRSLRSLTRGYTLPPLRGLLSRIHQPSIWAKVQRPTAYCPLPTAYFLSAHYILRAPARSRPSLRAIQL